MNLIDVADARCSWCYGFAKTLDALLAEDTVHSLRAFALRIGARAVRLSYQPFNINTPADLADAKGHVHGL